MPGCSPQYDPCGGEERDRHDTQEGDPAQVSTAGGRAPVWSHGGKELFFRNNHGDFVSAQVKTAPTFSVGEQKVLFSLTPFTFGGPIQVYAVAPDDKRFLMMRETSAGEAGLLVVSEHWFEELKAWAQK